MRCDRFVVVAIIIIIQLYNSGKDADSIKYIEKIELGYSHKYMIKNIINIIFF